MGDSRANFGLVLSNSVIIKNGTRIILEFDHTDGSLYWSCNSYDKDGGNDFYLIRFKLQDNTATFEEIGKIGNPLGVAKLSGLYIPFVLAGEDAPAKPGNVTI